MQKILNELLSRLLRFFVAMMLPLWGVPIFALLLFLGALLWAKSQDPFSRKWFTLETPNHHSFRCVAVLPKLLRQYPVMVYAHWHGGDLMKDGNDLRQMAELGLAAVSLEYDQTNETVFDAQFHELLHYLSQQNWANTNAIAWIGESQGAIFILHFVLQHPELQPRLLVLLSGTGVQDDDRKSELGMLHCRILLVHGEEDEMFPLANTEQLAAELRTNDMPVELKVMPGLPHTLNPENAVIFRAAGEYALTHLIGKNVWQNYHSIAQWQAEAPPFWLFCLSAAAWGVIWFAWWRHHKPVRSEKTKLKRHEVILRWLAAILVAWALTATAIHLVTPRFPVNQRTLSIAHRFLVQPKERADFKYLVANANWRGQKLETLLTDVELANYNRELINWQIDEKHYRKYVLSPVITGQPGEKFNWRRPLWEEFYPRIRHENSPSDAARIVVRHLRERVTIANLPDPPHDVPAIWLRQITDQTGFEIIYVAALRSVGIPARLDSQHQAEFLDGARWQLAPPPPVISWQ